MGKCLSCCEDSDDEAGHMSRNKGEHDKGSRKSDLGSLGGSISRCEGSSGFSNLGRGDAQQQQSQQRPNNANNGGGNQFTTGGAGPTIDGGGNGNGGHAAERRTFYPRIPPIRASSGGGDGRRSGSQSRAESSSEAKIVALYENYRDQQEDAILVDGIERLCRDLDVKPEEFRVLLLAWKFGAETMCRFSRKEFVGGCRALRVSSVRGIQSRFAELLQEVQQDPEKFKDLYRFTFRFGLDSGQRILPTDMAVVLWRLVLSQREPPLLPRWLAFLEKHPHVRGIPRDTWNMFLNFVEAVGDDLSTYDDAEAWPSLFDDFVEYENDQTNQNVQPSRKERKEDGRGSDMGR